MVITTSPLVKTYTLQEFWNLPEPADRAKLELIKGVLYMSPPPGEIHDDVFGALNRELQREIDRCCYKGMILAPRAAVWIDDATYLEPDLMYISDELKHQMKAGRRTHAAAGVGAGELYARCGRPVAHRLCATDGEFCRYHEFCDLPGLLCRCL